MRTILSLFLTAATVLTVGCNSVPLNMPANAPLKTEKGQSITSYPISAESCGFQLLLFIPIGVNSRQVEAYSKLISQSIGGRISDLKMEESWYYGLVGTGYCTRFSALLSRAN
ncbi:hypothetical protein EHO61_15070 [Leptospira fluminis]|uniref:Lipoprotein n=1 Tax=Leptospira fluminis TaxID=2484979 RepID=A0A4V3JE98_9LEPT|nr:hypothetical protein [Leptospira fluminis]TGK15671.1 hypothetical protein EHO61_15070 [Leptospira fluminis]